MSMKRIHRGSRRRRGLELIEVALILPLPLILVFGTIEYGWIFFKMQELNNAARDGARVAVLPDSTAGDVTTRVDELMTAAQITGYTTTVDPADPAAADTGDIVTVTVTAPYGENEILGIDLFPQPENLTASAAMAKEGP